MNTRINGMAMSPIARSLLIVRALAQETEKRVTMK